MLGFAKKMLKVDLSNGRSSTEEIQDGIRRNFLGGRGVCGKAFIG
jgi:aldehyde:ferredoxin oxidoreductase